MSTTAASWFYNTPENQAYLISERLNSTFWQARVVSIYWKGVQTEAPFKALGYQGDDVIEIEWEPGEWLALRAPAGADIERLVEVISKRILAIPATFSYETLDGDRTVEWHTDGGEKRWNELQGQFKYSNLERLTR